MMQTKTFKILSVVCGTTAVILYFVALYLITLTGMFSISVMIWIVGVVLLLMAGYFMAVACSQAEKEYKTWLSSHPPRSSWE